MFVHGLFMEMMESGLKYNLSLDNLTTQEVEHDLIVHDLFIEMMESQLKYNLSSDNLTTGGGA